MKSVISFENVDKYYNDRKVLSSLSFAINNHEVVGLLGPSGAGKTTILKLVAGLESASRGKVRVRAERKGYVFQEPRLFPWKTALDNITLPLKAYGKNKKEAEQKAQDYLETMGLAEFTNYYPSQLSGGMKQRVSIARAFAMEPDVLLLDEPFSALDIKLKNEIMEMFARCLGQQPMTVLYISHSPEEIAKIADRTLVMSKDGGLQEI